MGFRLDGYFLTGMLGLSSLIAVPHVRAQVPAPAPAPAPVEAPPAFDPSPIIGVPVEPGPAPSAVAPVPTATPAADAPAAAQPAAAGASAPQPPAAESATSQPAPGHTPPPPTAAVAHGHDSERPPGEPDAGSGDAGLSARLCLGIGASLWIEQGGNLEVWKPPSVSLDVGYALDRRVALIVRGSTWLRSGDPANEFLGVGGVYHFVADRLYVASVLGLSWVRAGALDRWVHTRQGLALEIDVGQTFAFSRHTDFAVGAHFQFGTPLLREADTSTLTSLHAGIFVALGLR